MKMGSRLIDLISKKTKCTCSTLFLKLAKSKFAPAARFFVFPLQLFCTTTTLFCTTKTLFTWSGGPRSSGIGFFCFHALGDTTKET